MSEPQPEQDPIVADDVPFVRYDGPNRQETLFLDGSVLIIPNALLHAPDTAE